MDSITSKLHIRERGIISFVGAGGKTTLMFRMAEELSSKHGQVLITTTTKILMPGNDSTHYLTVTDSRRELLDRAKKSFQHNRPMVAASGQCTESGKLIGFDPDFLDEVMESGRFRWILTEADGSARKPIKAPAAHEPVVPQQTRYLFGLIGLSALGKPVGDEHVHRVRHFTRVTGLYPGDPITPTAVTALIQHPDGLFKNRPARAESIAFLNQADAVEHVEVGQTVSEGLSRQPGTAPDILVVGQALKSPGVTWIHRKSR